MKIVLLILFLIKLETYANCELEERRFHTEAEYSFPENQDFKIYKGMSYDGGLLFLENALMDLTLGDFLVIKDGKYATLNNESIEGVKHFTLESVRGPLPFLRFKKDLNGLPKEPLVFIDTKSRKMTTTGDKYFPEKEIVQNDKASVTHELSDSLKKVITKPSFKIVEEKVNYSAGKIIQVKSHKLGLGNWKLVQVLTRFPLPKKLVTQKWGSGPNLDVVSIDAWVAFLSIDDKKFWYIGNSSGEPCGNSISFELVDIDKEGNALIGSSLEPKYGLNYLGNEDELIYSFGDSNIVYFLKFNKLMVVIAKDTYR